MIRSMRWRLLAWYAVVLAAVIGGFALVLYVQARRARFQQIDEQLSSAVEYFDATLKRLPPFETDWRGRPPFGLPPPSAPDGIRLTDEQRSDIEALDVEARNRLDEILTDPQRQLLDELRERPPRGRGFRPEPPLPPPAPRAFERVLSDLRLPASLLPRQDERPDDDAYFIVWRRDGEVLKTAPASAVMNLPATPVPPDSVAGDLRLRQRGPLREALMRGPQGTIILVGKPIAREMNDLASFAWRLAGSGCLALAVGLAGGWLISRGIVRPIARISQTAAAISASNLSGRIEAAPLDSELVGLAGVLNEMFSRLQDEFSRQTRFTADASHELRTPVALLHSQIELALKRERTPTEYREALETCLRASGRLRSLLEGLITLARADAGKLTRTLQPVDLVGLVEEVAAQHRGDAERAEIDLSTTIPGAPLEVNGDPVLLARLLANLLTNAIRHTSDGGRIQIALTADQRQAVLSIADSGCGIPEEDLPKIFERFYRVDKARSRSSGGSGLGLAICKSIVEAHSGTIACSSKLDEGTTFVVRLPIS
jgi:two-component system OmpR family sensor kinase